MYEARPGGRLLAFIAPCRRWRRPSVEGRCTASGCAAVLAAQGQRETRQLPPVGETAEQADAARLAVARRGSSRANSSISESFRVKKMEDRHAGLSRVAAAASRRRSRSSTSTRSATGLPRASRSRTTGESSSSGSAARWWPRPSRTTPLAARQGGPVRHDAGRAPRGALARRARHRRVPPARLPEEFQAADPRQSWAAAGRPGRPHVAAQRPAAADPARDAPRARGPPPGTSSSPPRPR